MKGFICNQQMCSRNGEMGFSENWFGVFEAVNCMDAF